ncbi:ribonuclease Z [Xylanibacter ruminicola]|jgi:ribonuclease Z|uniref:Ribonuclease Z n=1 Tax=Xylanibacter ruminicola TaxID=839 RepID=A0A1H5UCT1_XYLRU|nr:MULTISPECIES: ribonuclease Z [Prevotellaceae]SEF72111.1 ribonuclease Z [Xylanibacter ruminicola]SEV85482.1 ribonuclease Z [Prevotella sp. khp7]
MAEPFKVHILGCGSALPTLRHHASSQVVEVREKVLMLDCSEGTQMQLRKCRVRFTKLSHVFITHLHGDHCFGLIGMISTFGLLGRTAKLHVHGPKALGAELERQIKFFTHDLGFEVVFYPVDTTQRQVVYEDRSITVESIPLEHRVPTCGYLIREKQSLPHIRRDMMDCYQIPASQVGNIKNGADWITADGEVIPNARLVKPADPARCYAYISDTRYMPQLHEQLRGVTTLYHESTYGEDNMQNAEKYHHSTARQAALVARDAGVDKLLLGHYSSRYEDETVLLEEAKSVFENTFLTNEMAVFNV